MLLNAIKMTLCVIHGVPKPHNRYIFTDLVCLPGLVSFVSDLFDL